MLKIIPWPKSLEKIELIGAILAPFFSPRLVPLPYIMTLSLTRKCNGRCIMCGIWRENDPVEMSVEQAQEIFYRNDFHFLRLISITGGEPSLYPYLPEVLRIICKSAPSINYLQISTNGLLPERLDNLVRIVLSDIEKSLPFLKRFEVIVSLDAIGEAHDYIRGVSGAYNKVKESIWRLKRLQELTSLLHIRLSTVVIPENLLYLDDVLNFAIQNGLRIHFSPVVISSYYRNVNKIYRKCPSEKAASFFQKLAELENGAFKFYYQDMARVLQGDTRKRRCMMGLYGFHLESNGDLYVCLACEQWALGNLLKARFKDIWFNQHSSEIRKKVYIDCCPSCTSLCYTRAVNISEISKIALRKFTSRFKL